MSVELLGSGMHAVPQALEPPLPPSLDGSTVVKKEVQSG